MVLRRWRSLQKCNSVLVTISRIIGGIMRLGSLVLAKIAVAEGKGSTGA